MKSCRLALTAMSALVLASCAITSPSNEGEAAYRQEAWPRAESEFATLAANDDATAQFYMVVMSLRGLLAVPLDDETERSYLVSSAGQGETRALGLMVWLSAEPTQRKEWLETYRATWSKVHTLNAGENVLEQLREIGAMDRVLLGPMEDFVGGPLPTGAFSNLFLLITTETEDAFLSASLTLSDPDFLAVDQALARAENKEAQTRLALRHQEGRGVEQDDRQSIRLLRAAGSTTPGKRNCFYQPEVGKAPASVQCFGQGESTPGIARAQWELCQAYAFGLRTDKNESRAERWCNRAMRDPQYRTLARDVLIEMTPTPLSE